MNAKRMWIALLALAAVLALTVTAVSAQNGPGNGNGNGPGSGNGNAVQNMGGYQGGRNDPRGMNGVMGSGLHLNLPAAVVDELPQDVIDLMTDGWLDEQHAYAVYSAIIDQFGAVRPFVNIQRSEAQHISAWETLFARYDIAIPETPTFDLPTFDTFADACSIGIEAEVANADLYDTMLTAFEPYPDLFHVAQALQNASVSNHLQAVERCAR
mgnify:CR=1 FL=1